MTASMTNCDRCRESISLLAAGCLPTEEEAGVRQHLQTCAVCATRFAELTTLCTSLSRGRPPAAVSITAIGDRWAVTVEGATPHRPQLRRASPILWGSGALAVSLLITAVWLTQPQRMPPVERSSAGWLRSQPTLRDYARALNDSDDAFDGLLERHAASVEFELYSPPTPH